jgi:hypothetical protein
VYFASLRQVVLLIAVVAQQNGWHLCGVTVWFLFCNSCSTSQLCLGSGWKLATAILKNTCVLGTNIWVTNQVVIEGFEVSIPTYHMWLLMHVGFELRQAMC